jgi:UDP-N-acetylmuramoyl-L-alanyl-D-glutamate--2,6-diaminopimelate ligase
MAREAERLADRVVVTDDNPRSEDPETIARHILAGFTDAARVSVIHDRAEAIQSTIRSATPNDVVLIAGKGHEAYQEIAGQKYPFSDAEQVRHVSKLNGGVA